MSKSSRLKLLVLSLLIAIVSFAFACTTTPDDNGGGGGSNTPSDVVLDNYVNESWISVPSVYGDITLDGVIDETAWANQNKLTAEGLDVGGATYSVETSAYFANTGVVIYAKIGLDSGIYVRTTRGKSYNTGIELYINSGDQTSLLNNGWEIPINVNMNTETRLYFQAGSNNASFGASGMAIDVAATADGLDYVKKGQEINLKPEETSGYILEFYIPWTALNANGAPSSVKYDFAFLHMTSYTGENNTRIWQSFHDTRDSGMGINNIANRYEFNNRGYIDSSVMGQDRIITVNGVENYAAEVPVEGGIVNINAGKIGTSGTISVTPDLGYKLKNFTVNGRRVYESSFKVGASTGDIDVVVEFEPLPAGTVFHSFNAKVASVKGAPIGLSNLTGKHLVLESTLGRYLAEVDANGNASFVNVPVGKYTLNVDEVPGINLTYNVTEALSNETLNLEYDLFGVSGLYTETVGAEDYDFTINGNVNKGPANLMFNEQFKDVVWTQMKVYKPDVNANGFNNTDDVLLANVRLGNNVNYGIWYLGTQATNGTAAGSDGNLFLRTTNKWDHYKLGLLSKADSIQTKMENGSYLEIATSYSNGSTQLLYRVEGETEWSLWKTMNDTAPVDGISTNAVYDVIVDFKYATAASAKYAGLVNVTSSVIGEGTVEATGTVFGGEVIINPAPANGMMVYGVTVNGKSYPAEVAKYNNGLTNNIVIYGVKAWDVDVVITYGAQSESNVYTINLSDQLGNYVLGDVFFITENGYSPMVEALGGKVIVELAKNTTYTITVTGYGTATVSVDENGVVSSERFVLQKSILTTNSLNWQYGINDEEGNWATTVVKDPNAILYVDTTFETAKYVSFDIALNVTDGTQTGHYPGIAFVDADGTIANYQFCNWNQAVYFKYTTVGNDAASLKTLGNSLEKNSIWEASFRVYIDGTSFILTDAEGNFIVSDDVSVRRASFSEIYKFGFFYQYDDLREFKFTNVELNEGSFPYVELKAKSLADSEYSDAVNGVVTFDTFTVETNPVNVISGNTINVVVTPVAFNMENYYISAIKIDGSDVAFDVNSQGVATVSYKVPAGATSINVEVATAVAVPIEANVTFYKNGVNGKVKVSDSEVITFAGEVVTLSNGKVVYTGNAGIIVATIDDANYLDAAIEITESGDFEVVFNYALLINRTNDTADLDVTNAINGVVNGIGSVYNKSATADINTAEFNATIVYAEMTLSAHYAAKDKDCFIAGFNIALDDSNSLVPYGLWRYNDGWYARCASDKGSWANVKIANFDGDDDTITVDMAVVWDASTETIKLYMTDGTNGVRKLLIEKTNTEFNGIKGVINYIGSDATISNLKFATSIPASSKIEYASAEGTDDASYTVSGPATVANNGTATITVTPATGYALTNVSIAGATYSTAADGQSIVITLNNTAINSVYNVVVATSVANGVAEVILANITNYDGSVANISEVSLAAGALVLTADVVDGKATFTQLGAGSYTVVLDGYFFLSDNTVEVAGDVATIEVSATQNIFKKANTASTEYSDAFDYSYDAETGFAITAMPDGNSQVRARVDESIVGKVSTISFHYSSNHDGKYHFPVVYFVDENGATMGYQFCVWNQTMSLKAIGNNVDGAESFPNVNLVNIFTGGGNIETDVTFYFVSGTTVAYVFENSTVNGVPQENKTGSFDLVEKLREKGKTYNGFGTPQSVIFRFNKESNTYAAGPWSFSNFKFSNVAPSVPVEVVANDYVSIAVEGNPATASIGDSLTITVTPNSSDVTLSALVIAGKAISVANATIVDGAYVFSYVNAYAQTKLSISAIATDEVVEFAVNVPSVVTWGEEAISANGLDITLVNSLTGAKTVATINGTVANFALPVGDYSVVIEGGYETDTIVTVAEDTTEVVIADAVLNVIYYMDAGYYDTSDILNGNITFTNTKDTASKYMIFNTDTLGDIKYAQMTISGTLIEGSSEGWYAGFRNNGGWNSNAVAGPYHGSVSELKSYNETAQKYSYGLRYIHYNHTRSDGKTENISGYDELQYRYCDGTWTSALAHSFGTQNGSVPAGGTSFENFSIIWMVKDGKTYAYGAYGDEQFKLIDSRTLDIGSISVFLIDNMSSATISNFYVSNTVPTDLAIDLTNDSAKGTVTAEGSFLGDLVITADPVTTASEEAPYGYDIASVLVNGVDVLTNASVTSNGATSSVVIVNGENRAKTITLAGWKLPYVSVEVNYFVVEEQAVEYTFDINAKFTDENKEFDLTEGDSVIFTGAKGSNASAIVDANGLVTVILYADDYTITTRGGSVAYVADGDNSSNIELVVDIPFAYKSTTTSPVTINADGSAKLEGAGNADKSAYIVLFDGTNAGGFAFSWNHTLLDGRTDGEKYPGMGLKFTFADGTTRTENSLIYNGNNDGSGNPVYYFKPGNNTNNTMFSGKNSLWVEEEIDGVKYYGYKDVPAYLKISEDGTAYEFWANNVKAANYKTNPGVITKIELILYAVNTDNVYAYNNVRRYSSEPTVAITYAGENSVSTSASNVVWYGSTEISVTASEGYILDNITATNATVSNIAISSDLKSATATLTSSNAGDIIVTTTVKEEQVTSTVNLSIDGYEVGADGFVYSNFEGRTATITSGAINLSSVITGGIAKFEGVIDGDYTLTIDGGIYNATAPVTVAYSDGVEDLAATVEYELFSTEQSNYTLDHSTGTVTFAEWTVSTPGGSVKYFQFNQKGIVYAEMTLVVNEQAWSNDIYEAGFYFKPDADNVHYGLWNKDGNYKWREMTSWGNGNIDSVTPTKDVVVEYTFAVAVINNDVYGYVSNNKSDVLKLVKISDANNAFGNKTYTEVFGISNYISNYVTIKDLKLSTSIPASAINYVAGTGYTYSNNAEDVALMAQTSFDVVPEEGFAISTVEVTNANYTTVKNDETGVWTVTVTNNKTVPSEIKVTVATVELSKKGTITGTVTAKNTNGEALDLSAYTASLVSEAGSIDVVLDADGNFTATDLLYGTYTLDINGIDEYVLSGAITVDLNGDEATLNADVIDNRFSASKDNANITAGVANYTYDADANDWIVTGGATASGVHINGSEGHTVLMADVTFDKLLTANAKNFPTFNAVTTSGSRHIWTQITNWGANIALVLKGTGGNQSNANNTGLANGANAKLTITFVVVIEEAQFSMYVVDTATGKLLNSKVTAAATDLSALGGWDYKYDVDGANTESVVVSNIRTSNELPVGIISYNTDDATNDNYAITTAPETLSGLTGETTVVLTAAAGYVIKGVTVAGAVSTATELDGVYTITIANVPNAKVTISDVVIEAAAKGTYTYTFDWMYAEEKIAYDLGAGKTVTFTSEDYAPFTATVGENGSVTVELYAGEWTVNCGNATAEVVSVANEVATQNVTLVDSFAVIKETDNMTYSFNEDGTVNYKHAGTENENSGIVVYGGGVGIDTLYIEMDIAIEGTDYPGFQIAVIDVNGRYYGGNGNDAYHNMMFHNNNFLTKYINNNSYQFSTASGVTLGESFHVVYKISDGKTISAYVNGTWLGSYTHDAEIAYIRICKRWSNDTQVATINNIRRHTGANVANVTVEGENFTNNAPATLEYGKQQSVTITANDGFKIDNVTVTGAIVTKSGDANNVELLINAKPWEDVAISVETSAVQTKFNATYTLKNDGVTNPLNFGEYVAEGSSVEVLSGSNPYTTATVGANGAIALELEPGTYTVSVAKYMSFEVEVVDSDVSEIKALNYKAFKDDAQNANFADDGDLQSPAKTSYNFADTNVVFAEITAHLPTEERIISEGVTSDGTQYKEFSLSEIRIKGTKDGSNVAGNIGTVYRKSAINSTPEQSTYAVRYAFTNPSKWTNVTGSNFNSSSTDTLKTYYDSLAGDGLRIAVLIEDGQQYVYVNGALLNYDNFIVAQAIESLSDDSRVQLSNVRYATDLSGVPAEYNTSTISWTNNVNDNGSFKTFTNVDENGWATFGGDSNIAARASIGYNHNFTVDSKIYVDVTLSCEPTSGTGYWPEFQFKTRKGDKVEYVQFCEWTGNVNYKANGNQMVSATNMLNYATKEGKNWTFKGYWGANADGDLTLYAENGTVIYAHSGVKMAKVGGIDFYNAVSDAETFTCKLKVVL